ncbi:unnamed protein product, partial [Discosporangium mesarthrocarpum]
IQAHPAALGFNRGGVPLLLSAAVHAAKLCREGGGPLVAVQLDHATREEEVRGALAAGVDSVMIDGSALPFKENLAWTASVARLAHQRGVAVEAELGRLAGEEDGLSVAEVEARMTDPEQVLEFLEKTGADVLAVTIGNVHGKYACPDPTLDFPRLDAIRQETGVATPAPIRPAPGPLGTAPGLFALHGASGLPPGVVQKAIARGVCKLNVNTEAREAVLGAWQD